MDRPERLSWAAWRRRRDERAFEQLVQPHLPFLLDLARRLGCTPSDADDVAQQALCDLAAARGSRPVRVGLKAWLGRRVSLLARSLHRDTARRHARESDAAEKSRRTAMLAAGHNERDLRDEVEALLARLGPADREVLVLRYLHDLEYTEVGYVLGLTPSACRLRVHRALTLLRRDFGRAAPAALAALFFLRGARPAAALVSGALAVTATTKTSVTIAVLVLLVAALIAVPGLLRADDPSGRPVSQRPMAERREAPAASPNEPPIPTGPPAKQAGSRPRETQVDELQAYATARYHGETWKRLGALQSQLAGMRKKLESFGVTADRTAPRAEDADPATREYLRALLADHGRMAAGFVRRDLLKVLFAAHSRYLKQTGNATFVAALSGLADTTDDSHEKNAIVDAIAALKHPRAAGERQRFAAHVDPVVRAAVAPLLEAEGVVALVRDPDPRVRRNAALGLEYYVGDPAHVPALLENLAAERDPLAMDARVRAVRALDPVDGDARIERALRDAPDDARKLTTGITLPEVHPEPRTRYDDPTTKRYVKALWETWRGLPAGKARQRVLGNFTATHRSYVHRTGDRGLVGLIAQAVEQSEQKDERRAIVRSFAGAKDAATVDLLVTWTKSEHDDVRVGAVQALALVGGPERKRALRAMAATFQDASPSVRHQTAIFAGTTKSPDLVKPLLEALAVETDFSSAYGQAIGIVKLDPKRGRARIEELQASAVEPQRALIAQILSYLK